MNVTINIAPDSTPTELSAVISFCLALGGKAPAATGRGQSASVICADEAAPTPPAAPSNPVADALIEQHANSVASRQAVPTPPAAAGDVDPSSLDVEGIPWDARIHSTPAKRNADDTWRKKRGVDEVEYGKIHAELQAANASPNAGTGTDQAQTSSSTAQTPAAPPPPVSSAPTASEGAAPLAPTPTPAPPAPTAEAPAAPAPAESASAAGDAARFPDFPSLVGAVGKLSDAQRAYANLNRVAQDNFGLPDFKSMKDHADKWEMFYDLVSE